ncbi:universal stress protein [Marinobacter daepoensis]|uniref:Universal stress protein n=1 Tax=Marinobacter daepoensis TaxID=262077 RepID=A0ABS3BG39_9GAMM|nr:universal stress protein [Marinobacter daepoensis]MBN7770808.1 universal stress protein [Marinobacter daepoensis]MBY6033156.1 universal stress protein [Marinobacter daepoensis]MBY6078669.1 universal stress protein [Marinobacter daepoensis]
MKIMIAYDGSRNAKLALAQTITMFRGLEPELTLVAVAENPRDITSGNEDLFQQEVGELKQHLQQALEVCEREQVIAESLMLEGDARKSLLFAAEKKVRPDMLVIARHSHEPDGGFIARSLTYFVDELDYMTFGSVSSFLARRIQCPLLILPSH